MILARRRDAGVLALRARIVAAHQPLQLGELAHHLGDEIGLAQRRRALDKKRVGADHRRKLFRQRSDALHALALRAELFVKDDLIELRQTIFKPQLEISLVEELRVTEPCRDDALIARDDRRAAIRRLDVGDQNEAVGQFALAPQHKTFLVHTDRRADHFRRDRKEALVEFPHQHDGPFDEPRDFFEQRRVLHKLQPLREGEVFRVMQNDVAPPRGIDHDFGALQRHRVILEALHMERRRRHETMAESDVARVNAVDRETHDVRGLRFRTEHRDDRVERAHPAQTVRALRRCAPAHGFRPGKALHDRGQDFRQNVDRFGARAFDHGEIEFGAFLVLLDLRLFERSEAGAFQKTRNRGVGRADARTLALLAHIRLAGRQTDDLKRQPARRGVGRGAVVNEAAIDKRIGDELFQIVRRLPLHPRGDFFGEEFEKEVGHPLRGRAGRSPSPRLRWGGARGGGIARKLRKAPRIWCPQRFRDQPLLRCSRSEGRDSRVLPENVFELHLSGVRIRNHAARHQVRQQSQSDDRRNPQNMVRSAPGGGNGCRRSRFV